VFFLGFAIITTKTVSEYTTRNW